MCKYSKTIHLSAANAVSHCSIIWKWIHPLTDKFISCYEGVVPEKKSLVSVDLCH